VCDLQKEFEMALIVNNILIAGCIDCTNAHKVCNICKTG